MSSNWVPWIFLSHSGAQKGNFVTHLYYALRHVNHFPFFDQDTDRSLPVGLDYPPRIFQACQACKMGVVVLSAEDYIQSLWPMLELQHLLDSSSDCLIYPLFYKLRPADLSNRDNLTRWEKHWKTETPIWEQRMAELQAFMSSSTRSCEVHINLDIGSWVDNLKKLQYKSGEERNVIHQNNDKARYQSDYTYIQAIVSNICALLPPPTKYSLDVAIKGQGRMAQEIAKAFLQEESLGGDEVRALGVHGIGGSGKTTVCKVMTNFYSNEFPGRCFYLEFPSKHNDVKKLLHNIKGILPTLIGKAGSVVNCVSDMDQAMNLIEEGLQRNKVFLAIDNVWDHSKSEHNSFDYAKRTMLMKCLPGSKILVTSRSKRVLTSLLESRSLAMQMQIDNMVEEHSKAFHQLINIVHVPSLVEAEAVEALRSYSCFSFCISQGYLQTLARSCFFSGHCHPLYLKLKGVELQRKGRVSFSDRNWKDLISSLETGGGNAAGSNEEVVVDAVEKSLDAVPSLLQDLFIDLVTWDHQLGSYDLLEPAYLDSVWLHYDDMNFQVLELEYQGLLEVKALPGDNILHIEHGHNLQRRLVIHDLHKLVARRRASRPDSKAVVNHAVRKGNLSAMLPHEMASKKHVDGSGLKTRTLKKLLRKPAQVQIRVLEIHGFITWGLRGLSRSLNVNAGGKLGHLRALSLVGIQDVRKIKSWEGVPNLVWLQLQDLVSLERMAPIGCLKRLERLSLIGCRNLNVQALVSGGGVNNLQISLVNYIQVGDSMPKLEVVDVRHSLHLVEVGSRLPAAFPALTTLGLRSCEKLETFPDLKLDRLRVLDLSNCSNLRRMEGCGSSLTALERLSLRSCWKLERIPHFSRQT